MTDRIEFIKKLRSETGAGLNEAVRAASDANYDLPTAIKFVEKNRRARPSEGFGSSGLIETYNHNGRIGAMVHVACETDFVARTEEFRKLCRELAMQITATNPENVSEVMESAYVREPGKKIKDIVNEVSAKTGEKVGIVNFARLDQTVREGNMYGCKTV